MSKPQGDYVSRKELAMVRAAAKAICGPARCPVIQRKAQPQAARGRGRPRGPERYRRLVRFTFRISESEMRRLQGAANRAGMSLGEMVRAKVLLVR